MKKLIVPMAIALVPFWLGAQVVPPPPPPPPPPMEPSITVEGEKVTIRTETGEEFIIDEYGVRKNGVMIAGDSEGLREEMEDLREEIAELREEAEAITPGSDGFEELMEDLAELEEELAELSPEAFYPDTLPGDSTSVTIGKWRLIVKETGDDADDVDVSIGKVEEIEVDDHYVDPFQTEWWLFDMGYNTLLNDEYANDIPAPYDKLEQQQLWGSFDVNLHLFRSRVSMAKGFLNFNYGLSMEWHHFRFDDNFRILPDTNMVVIVNEETINFEKNKFNTTHVAIPLSIGFETKPWDTDHSFRMQFGYSPGLMLRGKTKYKYDGEKEIEKDDFNLSQFRNELNYTIGYGDFNVYASYDLNSMFREDRGPSLHPFSVGLIIRRGF